MTRYENVPRNKKSRKGLIKKLLNYGRPHVKWFVISLFLLFLMIGIQLIPDITLGKVLDVLGQAGRANAEKYRLIAAVVGFLVGMLAIRVSIMYFQVVMMQKIGQEIVLEIRQDTYEHIETLSQDQYNKVPVGKFVTRVTNDTAALNQMYSDILVNLISNVILLIAIGIALFVINWRLALYSMILVPIIAVAVFVFRNFSRKAYRRTRTRVSNLNSFLSENLSGMKITQIFNQEEKKINEFKYLSKELKKSYLREMLVFSIFRPIIYVLSTLGAVFFLYLSVREFVEGRMTAGTIFMFYRLLQKFYWPIEDLAEIFNILQASLSSAEKVFDVLNTKPGIEDKEGAIELETFTGHIEFKNVWFSYIPDEWILKDVSFEVKPNETVALVGATGSGKTTILNLIVRNYEIQSGEILIDGINVNDIKRSSLRAHVGQMLQDVFLFNATIKENITLFDDSIPDEKVIEAAKYVGANEFIEKLDDGYDHIVLERGNNFSAGQRQLISFARAILYEPNLMILDEATANIDSETEQLIQSSLSKMMNINTMIIVAHRLSTIQHSDKIIVMDEGEISEMGNHQELLAQKGKYYKLYELQYEGKGESHHD